VGILASQEVISSIDLMLHIRRFKPSNIMAYMSSYVVYCVLVRVFNMTFYQNSFERVGLHNKTTDM
jgi:hypothetical protein